MEFSELVSTNFQARSFEVKIFERFGTRKET